MEENIRQKSVQLVPLAAVSPDADEHESFTGNSKKKKTPFVLAANFHL